MANMTREQWVIINDFSSAVINLNSIFCEDAYSKKEIAVIVQGLADKIESKMAIEDAIGILQDVLKLKRKQKA